jgi:peptidyl-tRNA hydrolase
MMTFNKENIDWSADRISERMNGWNPGHGGQNGVRSIEVVDNNDFMKLAFAYKELYLQNEAIKNACKQLSENNNKFTKQHDGVSA